MYARRDGERPTTTSTMGQPDAGQSPWPTVPAFIGQAYRRWRVRRNPPERHPRSGLRDGGSSPGVSDCGHRGDRRSSGLRRSRTRGLPPRPILQKSYSLSTSMRSHVTTAISCSVPRQPGLSFSVVPPCGTSRVERACVLHWHTWRGSGFPANVRQELASETATASGAAGCLPSACACWQLSWLPFIPLQPVDLH